MKKLLRILFETAWGPVAACVAAAGIALAVFFVEETVHNLFGIWTANALFALALLVLLAAGLAALAAFVHALFQRHWRRALVQSLLELGVLALFAAAVLPVLFAGFFLAYHLPGGHAWHAAPGTPFPFAVQYRLAHPFLSEHDKRIVFPSGQSFGLWPDTGGDADFAAYALPDGTFALADGLRFNGPAVYRIDPAAETVEHFSGSQWISLPPGCRSITARDGGIFVQTRFGERYIDTGRADDGAFKARRFLGLVRPAAFDPDAPDPFPLPESAP